MRGPVNSRKIPGTPTRESGSKKVEPFQLCAWVAPLPGWAGPCLLRSAPSEKNHKVAASWSANEDSNRAEEGQR